MGEMIVALSGTPEGARLAMVLALISAMAHAVFGALQKWRFDPWLTRGAIDVFYSTFALPVALIFFPLPDLRMALFLVGVFVIHFAYKYILAMAYERAAYTVVYPVVRGTGPLVTVLGAWAVFGEAFTLSQWAGVLVLSSGIFGLAIFNLSRTSVDRDVLWGALLLAALTGVIVAVYTVYDAWGIRSVENPFMFLVWFFVVDGLAFPFIAWRRWQRMTDRPSPVPLLMRGFLAAVIAYVSFGGVMLALRLDKVGEAAILRETSTIFAALIGWLFLKETVGPVRMGLMALIALGAVIVEFGG
ncbi:EamA family transporter [Halovulum dunhuangense]|uniref:EamA family transporter n=1 Tax=Halovulum dunhuangense TaxID=1505036 RepID=A0A849L491_9RHOB|nr:DMT family transporter [Halovulum dunhuangense]NNU81012.1 EamA family transporter [Halovulum dunhuangense]